MLGHESHYRAQGGHPQTADNMQLVSICLNNKHLIALVQSLNQTSDPSLVVLGIALTWKEVW